MKRKLKNQNGETLAEVLIALLIVSLGVVLLASMIMASSRLIKKGETNLKNTYDAVNALEASSKDPQTQEIMINVGTSSSSVNANIYTVKDGSSLKAYTLKNK